MVEAGVTIVPAAATIKDDKNNETKIFQAFLLLFAFAVIVFPL